ncbi:MFS transporter [Mycolicibacterium conceptionense]|uniref:MFS transporter n=2 Tax=Mycolicibacterium TaxID=1866885 RepID=A0A1A1W5S5_9MYCO|nr:MULTISPECIES: MFS transporter [Mycolicibacterium]MCW1824278.1 MFS transporter [Mycolicibacterium senegalense]OBB06075.1 MFS transporter [Mycolicibacterium conceptionense]OBF02208.1 MFS transporter [Mycolicibacterium conceptionense]OBF20225.1 MFS transporter [Mycolicibacterium conceptionense]OBF47949.1 MFS transporter [Mycolicibacterium conceptionense]
MTTSLERARAIVAPDPTVRMLAVFALALGGFGIGTTEFVAMGLLPDIATGFGISEPTAGHVISAYALGVVVGAPVIAALTARWPRKALLLTLMAVFTLGNLASMLAPTYPTLVIARFVAGLPHGAFFGIAALAAAHLMGPQNRAKAVAYVLCGLTVATVLGVPLASWLGQALGWRSAFGLVVGVGLITLAAQWRWLPQHLRTMHVTSPLTELGALRRPQVWLAVLVGMIGFGGMFAVYTYISTTMTDVTGLSRSMVPVALMVFGLGMVAGNLIGGRLADASVIRALYLSLGSLAVLLAAFSLGSHNPWTALPLLFGVGMAGSAVGPALQTRLMDVARDAQTLAAALNHSALNIGNATGAWVGGLVIAAGLGYTAPAAAGALLAVGGLLVFTVSVALQRRSSTPR